jgi:hypothetical protein
MSPAHAYAHDRDAAPTGNVVPIKRVEDTWDPAEPNAETIAQRWDPESQFIGALMWLTADRARPILELVRDSDIERPLNRWAVELIRSLVDADQNPYPVLVVRAAMKQAPADYAAPYETREWNPGGHGGRYHQLTLHLAAAYDHVVGYDAGVLSYAREVLDDSYLDVGQDRIDLVPRVLIVREDLLEQFGEFLVGHRRRIDVVPVGLAGLSCAVLEPARTGMRAAHCAAGDARRRWRGRRRGLGATGTEQCGVGAVSGRLLRGIVAEQPLCTDDHLAHHRRGAAQETRNEVLDRRHWRLPFPAQMPRPRSSTGHVTVDARSNTTALATRIRNQSPPTAEGDAH